MDTKDKRRDGRRQNTPPEGARKPAKPKGRGGIFGFGKGRRESENSPRAQQRAEEARRQVMGQAARQDTQLPQEEVYRPEPTRERHAQEPPQAAPRQAAAPQPKKSAPKKNRVFGRFAARRQAKAAEGKTTVSAPKKNTPAVIYTKPLPFNLNRLLIQLLTITAMVLAFTLGLSIFFKVDKITVSGAHIYSEWTVSEASDIQKGDALLTFNRARAGARIRAELPYVDRVRFGIKLPDTVIIDIKELEVTYAIQATDGMWWFITSEGRVVEQTDDGTASNFTKIQGVTIEYPEVNGMAVAWEQRVATDPTQPGESGETGENPNPGDTEAPVVITNADRLAVALEIVRSMEVNDVVGQVAVVDVSDLGAITLTYGTRYEVRLGDSGNLDFKIAAMRDAVAQLSDYQRGVLDVTFVIWPDKVVFTPSED